MHIAATAAYLVKFLCKISSNQQEGCIKSIFYFHTINEEFNDLYCSPNIVRVIKLRRMGLAGHVARMGERRGV